MVRTQKERPLRQTTNRGYKKALFSLSLRGNSSVFRRGKYSLRYPRWIRSSLLAVHVLCATPCVLRREVRRWLTAAGMPPCIVSEGNELIFRRSASVLCAFVSLFTRSLHYILSPLLFLFFCFFRSRWYGIHSGTCVVRLTLQDMARQVNYRTVIIAKRTRLCY